MKKSQILISANSLEFLLNYKSPISKKLLKEGYEIYWNSPIKKLSNKKLVLIPEGIKYNLWPSSRKGIIVFIRMFLSYCKFVLKERSKKTIISHTYIQILLLFLLFIIKV